MVNVELNRDELMLLLDLLDRTAADFEPWLHDRSDYDTPTGYPSCVLLQARMRLKALSNKLEKVAPAKVMFSNKSQRVELIEVSQ